MQSSYLTDCLKRRVIFFTGKGGVGKSALAWATALLLKNAGRSVKVIQYTPLDTDGTGQGYAVPGIETLSLHPLECFKEYALLLLKFEKIYDSVLDNRISRSFILTTPGMSETLIAGKIWQLFDTRAVDTLIVDLPSSGHALSFFSSPLAAYTFFTKGFLHHEAGKIANMLKDPSVRLDFVAIPEEMSLTETKEFYDKLAKLHPFSFGFMHINQCLPRFSLPEEELIRSLPSEYRNILQRFEASRGLQDEALSRTQALPLPQIKIPKFPTENAHITVAKIMEALHAV